MRGFKNTFMENTSIVIKPFSFSELVRLYNVPPTVLRKWLKHFQKEIGVRHGRRYTLQQVYLIFKVLGVPGSYIQD